MGHTAMKAAALVALMVLGLALADPKEAKKSSGNKELMCGICKAAVTAIEEKYIGIYTQENKDYFTLGPKMACREHTGNPFGPYECTPPVLCNCAAYTDVSQGSTPIPFCGENRHAECSLAQALESEYKQPL